MRIEFGDEFLRRLACDPDFVPARWSREIVRAYRKKVQVLAAATDDRDLRAMRSLRLERLEGDRAGTYSIRVNSQYRLILDLRTEGSDRVVEILELVDYH
ncbi:type II toxin-antitoxin system RelE/ParE family toxin [Actinotalea sp. Marseille-Q4924]|uniref:type II toxin-antitoxin system RelE/ParE family toxin n=1 Tax=Actinotalea sp. Marseille-Q4924 TaxID=2866571 RepID=UPI001CE47651|nr:type II toxin-antitoxin system RelE/ParE family toxin [Actinotalea sp. Marseille-Q4924]